MSAALPTAPQAGLGVFRDITPGGISHKREDATWAAATLDGVLYLASAGLDSRTVLRFPPATGKWETVYEKSTRRSKTERGNQTGAALPSLRFLASPFHTAQALYLEITAGGQTEHVRSSADGSSFDIVPSHFPDVEKAFPVSAAPALPDHPATSKPSLRATFARKTAVALDDAALGCSVWIALPKKKWQPAITRGAHRFSANAEVLAAEPWKDSLILALGKSGPAPAGKPAAGFEIVRLYGDGTWDLLVGEPRVSNQGLKVPLACLGPGMNEFDPSRFCFFTAGKKHLLLGTYDDVAGFRIWRSDDGIEWAAGEAELVGIDHVLAGEPVSVAGGTALILDLESPQHGKNRAIWIGE